MRVLLPIAFGSIALLGAGCALLPADSSGPREQIVRRPVLVTDVCRVGRLRLREASQKTLRDFYCAGGYAMALDARKRNLDTALRAPPLSLPAGVSVRSFILDKRHQPQRDLLVAQMRTMRWLEKSP